MNKILIVDDDQDMRETLAVVLRPLYEVLEADSEKSCYEKLKTFSPDCIVLDVMMEEDDSGFKVSRNLKNDPLFRHVKILMLTTIERQMYYTIRENEGDQELPFVDDYLEKPIDPKMLLKRIAKLLA